MKKQSNDSRVFQHDRISGILFLCLCAVFILSFAILYYALPDMPFSEQENQSLQVRPRFSWTSYIDGSFSADLDSFYQDQLPFRTQWLSSKALSELALGKGENNAVLFCRDGYLIKRLEYERDAALQANLSGLSHLIDDATAMGIPLQIAIAPRSIDVHSSYLPDGFDSSYAERVWSIIDDSSIPYLSFSAAFQENQAAIPLYYKTDHHWTTDGAYLAYTQLAPMLGISAHPISHYSIEEVSTSFKGTTYNASGMFWINAESIRLYRYPTDSAYTLTDGTRTTTGFYDFSALKRSSQYELFLGGNAGHLTISDGDTSKPTLLIIKDSFANSLIPFLAEDFQLEVLDLRYYKGTLSSFVTTHSIDQILVLYGVDSLATGATLAKISLKPQ